MSSQKKNCSILAFSQYCRATNVFDLLKSQKVSIYTILFHFHFKFFSMSIILFHFHFKFFSISIFFHINFFSFQIFHFSNFGFWFLFCLGGKTINTSLETNGDFMLHLWVDVMPKSALIFLVFN